MKSLFISLITLIPITLIQLTNAGGCPFARLFELGKSLDDIANDNAPNDDSNSSIKGVNGKGLMTSEWVKNHIKEQTLKKKKERATLNQSSIMVDEKSKSKKTEGRGKGKHQKNKLKKKRRHRTLLKK